MSNYLQTIAVPPAKDIEASTKWFITSKRSKRPFEFSNVGADAARLTDSRSFQSWRR